MHFCLSSNNMINFLIRKTFQHESSFSIHSCRFYSMELQLGYIIFREEIKENWTEFLYYTNACPLTTYKYFTHKNAELKTFGFI